MSSWLVMYQYSAGKLNIMQRRPKLKYGEKGKLRIKFNIVFNIHSVNGRH